MLSAFILFSAPFYHNKNMDMKSKRCNIFFIVDSGKKLNLKACKNPLKVKKVEIKNLL